MIKELCIFDKNVIEDAIKTFGEKNQKIVAIEELSELQKELTKDLRGQMNSYNLAEEFADVLIMLHQLIRIYGIESKVNVYWDYKIEKLKERIKDAGKEDESDW